MWRRRRPGVKDFAPDDDLYCRFPPAQIECGSVVVPMGEQPPCRLPCSVNWSRFSEPEWVLIPPAKTPDKTYAGFRVGTLRVQDIPSDPAVLLKPVHDPCEDNYSHSEIRSYTLDGEFQIKPSRPQRKTLRELLRRAFNKRPLMAF